MSRRRRIFGVRGFESAFDSDSRERAALILDYAGVVGGQFWDGTSRTLTFDDLHTFTRASLATQRNSSGFIEDSGGNDTHRLDHDISGNRIGLLIEEARTNIVLQSNAFDTTWAPQNAATMAQTTTGPDGLTSGWLFKDDNGGGGQALVRLRQTLTVDISTQYTYSVFAKKDQLNFIRLRLAGFTTPVDTSAWFNLDTGAVATVDAGFTASGIEDYGNGWYRCHVKFTTDGTDTTGFIFLSVADNDADNNVDRDNSSSIFLFGAQFEKGSFPTSYIPTTTGAVTRADEDAKIATSAFSYDASTGSVIANWIHPTNAGNPGLWMFNDGTPTAARGITLQSEEIRLVTRDASNANATATTTSDAGTEYKAAGAWNSSKHAFLSVNGGAVASDIADTISPTITTLYIGFQNTSTGSFQHQNGPIKSIAYFAPKLSNADLIAGSTV